VASCRCNCPAGSLHWLRYSFEKLVAQFVQQQRPQRLFDNLLSFIQVGSVFVADFQKVAAQALAS
jgi:hypothetical protein